MSLSNWAKSAEMFAKAEFPAPRFSALTDMFSVAESAAAVMAPTGAVPATWGSALTGMPLMVFDR